MGFPFKLLEDASLRTEVEGITDLLLQVTKAADTADTTVTHSYY
jgi:hypothetical protein